MECLNGWQGLGIQFPLVLGDKKNKAKLYVGRCSLSGNGTVNLARACSSIQGILPSLLGCCAREVNQRHGQSSETAGNTNWHFWQHLSKVHEAGHWRRSKSTIFSSLCRLQSEGTGCSPSHLSSCFQGQDLCLGIVGTCTEATWKSNKQFLLVVLLWGSCLAENKIPLPPPLPLQEGFIPCCWGTLPTGVKVFWLGLWNISKPGSSGF